MRGYGASQYMAAGFLLLLPRPAAAPFSCSSISIDCMCNWGTSGAWMQVGGLTKAPAEAQDSAQDCERWCCTKLDGWKDSPANGAPAGKQGTPGTGRCQTWQFMPLDPTGKESLGCWAGISPDVSMYTQGSFHSTEWVGAAQCLGIGTDWGTPFLFVLFLGTTLYLGGGAIYLKQKHGASGKDLLPHRRKWQHVHGLVLDGVAVVRGRGGKGGRGGGGGTPMAQSLLADSESPDKAASSSEGSRREGRKDEAKAKRGSGGGGKKDGGSLGKRTKEAKASGKSSSSKDSGKSKSRSKDKERSRNTPPEDSAPEAEADGAATAERQLMEKVEQDERLHQSQAKIKVIGLNG
eukprot:COSAG06_NODE_105_length_23834_cov_15.256710_9_plen_349_part_00